MKKIFVLVVLLTAVMLVSCATVANNKVYQEYKAEVIQAIEEALSTEFGSTYNNEPIIDYMTFIHDVQRKTQGNQDCVNDMRKTLEAYEGRIAEYNAKVNRLIQEQKAAQKAEDERKEREYYASITNTVNGDANWLTFQRMYCVESLYKEILSRNPSMSRYSIEVFTTGINDYQSRNPALSQEQKDWIDVVLKRIFTLALTLAFAEQSNNGYVEFHRFVRESYDYLLAYKKSMGID
jgi:hypothetical protein